MAERPLSLRSKATSGVVWSAFERFGQQGCAFFVQLVLARLLAPEQFGLIAMVVVFISISSVLIDAGFSRALIQRKEVSDSDLSTVFYFNLGAAVLLATSLYSAAPSIATFYDQSELSVILRFLCLGLLVSAFGTVHQAILMRDLLFKKLFWVSFPSTIISGIMGVILAVQGYGVWSLVAQVLCQRTIATLSLWFQTGWRPMLVFDLNTLKEMFPYGARLAASAVLDQGFQNIYLLVIGKFFPPAQVGFFQRARSFQQLPVQNFQAIFSRVAFPLFASIQNDPIRMKRGMRQAVQVTCLFIFSGMALLAAIAEPMVLTLIGDKWLPCVPYLQWLCLVGALYPIHAMNTNLLAAIGRSDLFLRLEIVKKVLIVLNIALTFRFGVQVMICGMIVMSVIALSLNTFYTRKFIDYGLWEQCRDVSRTVVLSLLVLLVTRVVGGVLQQSIFISLLLSSAAGSLTFLMGIRFLNASLKQEISTILTRLPYGRRVNRILL